MGVRCASLYSEIFNSQLKSYRNKIITYGNGRSVVTVHPAQCRNKFNTIHLMKKVLVIDDDKNILEVVEFILTSYGFDVFTLSTGFHVPEIVLHYQPDLILLDILLPGKLGTQICKELKQVHSDIPIILFSAHTQHGKTSDIYCADAFIQKPFDIKNFVDTVKVHVN
jgi:CheY-like chemotaxis protein